ncbi:hypothetical protein G9A89_008952 [Geosiphon pyriformis]|nr:hypothetical protein G9A89_008952 [Geosiphon pyriformis]
MQHEVGLEIKKRRHWLIFDKGNSKTLMKNRRFCLLLSTLVFSTIVILIHTLLNQISRSFFPIYKQKDNQKISSQLGILGQKISVQNYSRPTVTFSFKNSSTKLNIFRREAKMILANMNEEDEGKFPIDDRPIMMKRFNIYARYASLGYCRHSGFQMISNDLSVRSFVPSDDERSLLVSFRTASISRSQWIEREFNLVAYPSVPNARVDEKFYDQYRLVSSKIKEKITKLRNKLIRNFILVGHSTAGVYALFLALDLSNTWKFDNFTVVTYGQPRIGNKYFAQHINTHSKIRTYRLTNTDDYVPRLPVYGENQLVHHSPEYWIAVDCDCWRGKVYRCQGPIEDNKFIMESKKCNNRYHYLGDSSHYGPYFGVTMKECDRFNSVN